jgi:hypothetical protein
MNMKRLETKINSLQNIVDRLTQKKLALTNKKVDFKVQYGGGTSKLTASQLQRKQNMSIQHTNVNTQLQQTRAELKDVRKMMRWGDGEGYQGCQGGGYQGFANFNDDVKIPVRGPRKSEDELEREREVELRELREMRELREN